MTPQEAISTIKTAIAQVEWDYPMDYVAAFDMAVDALERQEPVAPRYEMICDNKIAFCGNCDRYISLVTNYCSYCGRAVKWE